MIFFSITDWSIFTSIASALLDWSNKPSWVFPALKSTSHFSSPSPQCLVDYIQVQKPLLVQIRCLVTLRVDCSIISINSNITDNIIRKVIDVHRKSREARKEPWGNPALAGYSCDDFPSRIIRSRQKKK